MLDPDTEVPSQQFVLGPGVQVANYGTGMVRPANFCSYWRFLRRHVGFLALSAVAGVALGLVATVFQPPLYEAKASLEIQDLNDNFLDMKQVLPVSDTSGQANEYGDIQTQIKILQSQSVLNPVIAKLPNLEAQAPEKIKPITLWPKRLLGLAPNLYKYLKAEATRVSDSLKVRAVGQTRIVELSAESTNPRIAADFLNQLSAEYIEQNIKSRWEMSQRTSQSLAHLLEDAQRNLRNSETALQSYAQSSGLMYTSDNKNVDDERLSEIQAELSKAQANRMDAQSRYEVAQRHLADAEPAQENADPVAGAVTSSSLRLYEDKLADLQQQRAQLAVTYTPDYSKMKRLDAQIASLQDSITNEKKSIVRRAQNEYLQASREEALLAQSYAKQSALVSQLGKRAIQYNILQRELDGNRELYDGMLKQVKEATLASAIPSSNVRVLDRAEPPLKPSSPKLPLNCALGLFTGLAGGLMLVFVRDRSDDRMREPGDGLRHIGLPELGVVLQNPRGSWLFNSPEKKTLMRRSPSRSQLTGIGIAKGYAGTPDRTNGFNSLWSRVRELHPSLGSESLLVLESFRAVVTSLLLSSPEGTTPRSLVVTSPSSGEGKTTVVANMGLILALMGRRVLLVDGDLRRPRLHNLFALDCKRGLSTLLEDGRLSTEPLSRYVQSTAIPGLSVLVSGPASVASANLLYSREFPELLARLKREYEFVLIDTPPVLQVADARVIGRQADGVILVVRAGKTARDAASAARQRLDADRTNVLGLILNDWDPSSSSYGYYADYAKSA
jgi:capsular exopolysaccharide synthesis family protein